jgi:hypothetical protein
MKADDAWAQLEDEVEPFRVESRKRLFRLGYGAEPKLVEIGGELRPHPRRCHGISLWWRVDEKVEIEGPVCRLAHRRDLLSHHRRRQCCTAERAQAAGVANGGRKRRRCKPAHRRLDHRLGNAEQFEKIGSWPHEITPGPCRPAMKSLGARPGNGEHCARAGWRA